MVFAIHPTLAADMVAKAVGGVILIDRDWIVFPSRCGHNILEAFLGGFV
jgi:hypothetical protein